MKEPSPSNLVNETKTGCQNMINRQKISPSKLGSGTKIVFQNWLKEQKLAFIFGYLPFTKLKANSVPDCNYPR